MATDSVEIINFRAPRPLVEKLDQLAAQTDRTRSSVLRALLVQAQAGAPDVVVREPVPARQVEAVPADPEPVAAANPHWRTQQEVES